MTPIATLLVGQLLVFLDVRVGAAGNGAGAQLDLLPDPVGWALTVYALVNLARLSTFCGWAAGFGVLAALLSLPDWVRPYRTVDVRNAAADHSLADLADLATVYGVAESLVAILAALGLRQAATRAGWRGPATAFGAIAAAFVALDVLSLATTAAFLSGVLSLALTVGLIVALGLVIFATYIGWLVLLFLSRYAPWADPAHTAPAAAPAGQQPF